MSDLPSQPSLFQDSAASNEKQRPRSIVAKPPAISAQRQNSSARLWLALYLPDLCLEALHPETQQALAVLSVPSRQQRVLGCNLLAREQGVRPGLPANAALALAPNLQLLLRDEAAEARALARLARIALDFSPAVSLQSPSALLLEIRGSLKLFSGAARLQAQFIRSVQLAGHHAQTAVAPTAGAALCLARVNAGSRVESAESLPAALAPLPLSCLQWPQKLLRALAEMGVRCFADCIRLPRAGLARRLGSARLAELDQIYGRAPEVRSWYQPEQHFIAELELPAMTAELDLLHQGMEILLGKLGLELRRRQSAVSLVWLRFQHPQQAGSLLRLGLLEATGSTERLLELFAVKLAATTLPAPVLSLELRAGLTEVPDQAQADLLSAGSAELEAWPVFMARLRARLGDQAVHGLCLKADHRPEHAWQPVTELLGQPASPGLPIVAQRPLWILAQPRRLYARDGKPSFQGRLQLEQGPERIETGWWDGQDVRRDYYRARNAQGLQLWVFHDLRAATWYLHGLFD